MEYACLSSALPVSRFPIKDSDPPPPPGGVAGGLDRFFAKMQQFYENKPLVNFEGFT